MMKNALLYFILPILFLSCSSFQHDFEEKNTEKEIIKEHEKVISENLPKDRRISGAINKGEQVICHKLVPLHLHRYSKQEAIS